MSNLINGVSIPANILPTSFERQGSKLSIIQVKEGQWVLRRLGPGPAWFWNTMFEAWQISSDPKFSVYNKGFILDLETALKALATVEE